MTAAATGSSAAGGWRAGGGAARWARLAWPLLALGALGAYNLVASPGFFATALRDGHLYGSWVDVLNRAAPLVIVSLGMTVVIATAGVDLSVGSVMAIAAAVMASLITGPGALPWWAGAGAALGVCVLCGAWNGLLVAALGIQPIVATLLLMVAGRGIAQLITQGQVLVIPGGSPLMFLGRGYLVGLPFTVAVAAAMFALTGALTRLTRLGLFLEAVGGSGVASRLAGVPDRLVRLAAYSFAGLCAGIAGLMRAADVSAADANNIGQYWELDAILAVVLGGTALVGGRFLLLGAVIGALIIQTLTTTILTAGVPVESTLVVKALVVLGVCLLQSPRTQRGLVRWRRR